MEASLLIYCARLTPRVRYTFSLLFDWVFPLPYHLTAEKEACAGWKGPLIIYGEGQGPVSCFRIPAGHLLFEGGIRTQSIQLENADDLPFFFRVDRETTARFDLPFDLPAMCFYLAARYEEYLPFPADRHGRFPASASLAGKAGFLHRPLINCWVRRLVELLERAFPGARFARPSFRFLPTFDIDMAWAFRHRPWWMQIAGTAKSLATRQWAWAAARWKCLLGLQPDPFYTFDYIRRLHPPGTDRSPIFFFLMADPGPFDRNTAPDQPAFRKLIGGLAEDYPVGIHLSYRSNLQAGSIPKEIKRLDELTRRKVLCNRQHFLKLSFPETYRRLLAHGIQADYSLGFADDFGFRAGVASPFPWYDLAAEEERPLILYPFALMEVTLQKYLGLEAQEAWAPVWQMVAEVQQVGGFFSTLWHNSSLMTLEESMPWRLFYERLIREINDIQ